MKDYTGGLDAEIAAYMEQYIHDVEEYDGVTGGASIVPCYPTEEVVKIAAYDVECRGYHSYLSDDKPTKLEVLDNLHSTLFHIPEEAEDRCKDTAENALAYIRNLDVTDLDRDGNYFHNLKAIALQTYVSTKNIGVLVSLIPTYMRHLKDIEYKKKLEDAHRLDEQSEHVGEIGQKISVNVLSVIKVSEWSNMYGCTYLYKINGSDGNVYMWYSSRWFGDSPEWASLTGTIKDHQEYRGVKQTILTRCRVIRAQR